MGKSVYDPAAFECRVNYAAQCIMIGRTHTRHFDTCFEMYDGDYVVSALMRRAEKNSRLMDNIKKFMGSSFSIWQETHESLKHIPRRKLAAAARAYIEDLNRPRKEFYATNRDNYISTAAWGSWHRQVPTGCIGVAALTGAHLLREKIDPEKYFLVSKEDYDSRGEFGLVINLSRHVECDPL